VTATLFDPRPMDEIDPGPTTADAAWVWDGFLARGDITLLTGVWKTGKTTLLAGLLHALGGGGSFLGRACAAGAAVVVSEESLTHWAERRRAIPVGAHARLLSRPFAGRPEPCEWADLVGQVGEWRAAGGLDLFVVDPLATFLPGRSESDAATLHAFLDPLRRLAQGGTAVLVLHHPRRQAAEEGSQARGGGVLLGYADTLLELHPVGRSGDGARRRLTARSRRPGAAPEVVFEWVVGTPEFRVVADDAEARFRENWEAVRVLLADRVAAVTHRELLADWPPDRSPPSARVLYDWLRRAAEAGLAVRTGSGNRYAPFRFALPRPAAPSLLPDLPELPPLRPPRR